MRWNVVQYFICKLLIVVKTYLVDKSMVAQLYIKIHIWKAFILIHTGANEHKHLHGAVCSKTHLFQTFSDFKIWRLTISKPVDLEISYLLQKKVLNSSKYIQFWKLKNLYYENLASFTKSGAFLIRRTWRQLGWCHALFLSWFKELYIRDFQWYNHV